MVKLTEEIDNIVIQIMADQKYCIPTNIFENTCSVNFILSFSLVVPYTIFIIQYTYLFFNIFQIILIVPRFGQ